MLRLPSSSGGMQSTSRRSHNVATFSSKNGHSVQASRLTYRTLLRVCYVLIPAEQLLTRVVLFQNDTPTLWQVSVAGVALSHVAHYGSMLLMWSIASRVTDSASTHKHSVPFVAALLYIFSPAGIFLSAVSTESVFALQSFLGVYLYITIWDGGSFLLALIRTILAGAIFMRATITRSNGILAGILFAVDAIDSTLHTVVEGLDIAYLARLASSVAAGLLVGWGMVWPQLAPYADYCVRAPVEQRREWCKKVVPSIYTFVQSHYWQVHSYRSR